MDIPHILNLLPLLYLLVEQTYPITGYPQESTPPYSLQPSKGYLPQQHASKTYPLK